LTEPGNRVAVFLRSHSKKFSRRTTRKEYAMDKSEHLARLQYTLETACQSRCDCAEVDQEAFDDLTRLIERLEAKIAEMERAA